MTSRGLGHTCTGQEVTGDFDDDFVPRETFLLEANELLQGALESQREFEHGVQSGYWPAQLISIISSRGRCSSMSCLYMGLSHCDHHLTCVVSFGSRHPNLCVLEFDLHV